MEVGEIVYTYIRESKISIVEAFEDLEKEIIEFAMRETNQCGAEASRILGINRTTLVEKRRKHGMKLRKFRRSRRA